MGNGFVHLHNHTEYSILDGAARIGALFDKAAQLEMPALAVTDHGVMYGAIDFLDAGTRTGVKPIIGAELYIATRSRFEKSSREKDFNHHLTVLAETTEGYRNLMKLVSAGWLDGYYYRPRVDKEILAEHARGLIGFSGCLAGEVCTALKTGQPAEAERAAAQYRDIFGAANYFIELQNHGLAEQREVLPQLVGLAGRIGSPLVPTNDLHYTEKRDAPAHDVLLCIQTNAKINEPGRFKFEAEEFYLKSAAEMRELFRDHTEACDNTLAIAERCDVQVEMGTLRLPPFAPPTAESQEAYLQRLVAEGAARRYGDPLPPDVAERVEHELGIIVRMGFAGYFLIVADLISFARSRKIRVGPGRGSAAGSVVSYCLGITDLDPIRYGLIFERFLNPDRRQMPDIDMDFDDRRRAEMIRYATDRYGEDRVAQIVTFGTIKGKQAIRDAARVLDLPYGIGDRLAKMYPPPILGKDAPLAACFDRTHDWPDPGVNDAFPQAADLRRAYDEDEISRQVLDIARELEGLRRQVSVHAAGVVIGDAPLVNYTPLQRTQDGAGGIVTQYEMHAVEDLGLLKMDFLGLRNLTVLEDAVRYIERTRGVALDIDNVPLDDRRSFEMLSRGDTIAVFQLESPGMRDLCKKLRPDRFEDVMALVALYRPGPLGERMHLEYAARKHGQRTVEYLHPDLKPILEETFGIILYQEQALRIAVDMAGFSMAEADTLRKAIGKKIGSVMRAQREMFVSGCTGKGYAKDLADKLWEMIDHFSGYGFNKCLIGSTRIPDATTGRMWTIQELFKEGTRIEVSSLNAHGKRVSAPIGEVWFNGAKPVFRLKTRLGREIIATDNHPFYAADGWRMLRELHVGDRIAAPRSLPVGDATWPQHKLVTLGWVLSEGNTCHPSGFYLYSTDSRQAREMEEAVARFDDTATTARMRRGLHEIYVRSLLSGDGRFREGENGNGAPRSGARLWLESLGLVDHGATTKFVPCEVFELRAEDLAVFVGRLWSGDGFVSSGTNLIPFYATSSRQLASDLQDLLLRLGIISRVSVKSFKYRSGTKQGFTVHVADPESVERFVAVIGPHLVGRDDQLQHLAARLARMPASRSSKDVVPVGVRRILQEEKVLSGLRWTDIETATGLSMREISRNGNMKKRGFRRSTVLALAEHFDSDVLRDWATADIYWDTIVSIEPAGEEETFDLEVPGTHNFVAEGLYVHNSHSCGYAFIAYQTAYLKANHPVEYMAALLTSVKDKQDRTALYLAECRTMGITVDPPDVNLSQSDYTPLSPSNGKPGEIRIGLSAIRNVGENVVAEIIRERERGGPFASFADFCHRVDPAALNKRLIESFVKAGAFDSLGLNRADFLTWGTDTRTGEARLVLSETAGKMLDGAADDRRKEQEGQSSLFGAEEKQALMTVNGPSPSDADMPRSALLAAEKEMLGLYVSDHPLLEVERALRASTDTPIADCASAPEGSTRTVGGLVSRLAKKFTKKGEAMAVVMLEDLAGAIEVVVFPSSYEKFAPLLAKDAIVCVKGKIDLRDDAPKLVALEIWKPNLAAGGDPLVLDIPAAECTPGFVEQLKEVLSSHPGLTPVHLRLNSGENTKVLRLPDDFRIERRNGLYAELKTLLGAGAMS